MPGDKPFQFTFRVPWADADPAGIVYFSHCLKYFELAEFELYRTLGKDVNELVNEYGILLPRVEVHCQFFRPIRWDDLVEVHLQVNRLTEKSVTYHLNVFRCGETELLTEGTMTVVCVDRKRFRARPFPPALFELLRAYLERATDVQ